MFRIGEFARIGQVTIKTLRYYDRIGLLTPNHTDPFTGYRYYTMSQLPRLNRILAMKDLGLCLEEILQMLNNDLNPEEIKGILKMKAAELETQIQDAENRLASVKARLHMMEKETQMPQEEVVFKSVPAQRYLSYRLVTEELPQQFMKMNKTLAKHPFDGWTPDQVIALYYGPGDENGMDMAVGVIVPDEFDEALPVEDGLMMTVAELPAVEKMACLLHRGGYGTLCETYQAFWRWIEANDYRIIDPCREVYLNDADKVPEEELLTEIQYQLEKR